MTRRVLITGAGGQLGRELVDAFAGWDVVAADRARLDVTDRDAVLAAVTDVGPTVVVNAAAWTAVDACESDLRRALLVNGVAVRWLAEACRRAGAHLVQVSTDYVFSGELDRPHTEWDTPDPRSAYGRSKLAGEIEAAAVGATIVRTSWLFGRHGSDIVATILRLAAEPGRELAFVDDQRGCPTEAGDLARAIRWLADARLPGIVHVTNAGAMTWFDLARLVLAAAGHDPDRVRAVATAELDPVRPAPRPANSVLADTVAAAAGLPPRPPSEEALRGV
ncbi:MAG TPA: dTDP-4-dehydrorhamnose reductase, partial [Acidimicrobiales bacterium]|nr:dTDP-4-dehydrorhamnose reductase [Acidimicrobiales bacterium]